MAQFVRYTVNAADSDGEPLVIGETVTSSSRKAAWHKAVDLAFSRCLKGEGRVPESIEVYLLVG